MASQRKVETGTIVTLIGANGAGKTTTLRAISGLLKARGGKINYDGDEITNAPPHKIVARGLAMCRKVAWSSPISRCWRTFAWVPTCGATQQGITTDTGVLLRHFPTPSRNASSRRRAPCPVANSRCWPSRER